MDDYSRPSLRRRLIEWLSAAVAVLVVWGNYSNANYGGLSLATKIIFWSATSALVLGGVTLSVLLRHRREQEKE
jgi:hypothetical protein